MKVCELEPGNQFQLRNQLCDVYEYIGEVGDKSEIRCIAFQTADGEWQLTDGSIQNCNPYAEATLVQVRVIVERVTGYA